MKQNKDKKDILNYHIWSDDIHNNILDDIVKFVDSVNEFMKNKK